MTPSAAASSPGSPLRRRLFRLGCILVFWLLVLEGISQLVVRWKPELVRPAKAWLLADAFEGSDWVESYFTEWWESYAVRWEPYVYWRRRPYEGDFIHVNEQGIRTTWRADADSASVDPVRVFMFGGSTLWGFGARDDYTIPSYLAKQLHAAIGRPVEVLNYGESGYVNTQETVALLRLLQAGDVPDIVIFYDGNNDVFSAYQAGQAGLPQNEYRRRKEFNLLRLRGDKTGYLVAAAVYHALQHSAVLQLFQAAVKSTEPPRMVGAGAPPLPPSTARAVGREAAEIYLGNVRMLQALAREYGFALHFFWQPMVFDKPVRSDFEQIQSQEFRFLRDLHVEALAGLRSGAGTDVHFLSHVFDETPDPVFIDFCHVSEAGNEIIAGAMLPRVLASVRAVAERP